jgi:hypothetical protein
MDEQNILGILGITFIVSVFAFLIYADFSKMEIAKEAIKAGLVGKVDQNRLIWVRP